MHVGRDRVPGNGTRFGQRSGAADEEPKRVYQEESGIVCVQGDSTGPGINGDLFARHPDTVE